MATADVPGQRTTALAAANVNRLARLALKAEIAAGKVSVTDVIADPPPFMRSMAVIDLLCAQHRVGSRQAREVLARLAISEQRTLGALTDRQRKELIDNPPRPSTGGTGHATATRQQSLTALGRANAVRSARAQVKRDVAVRRLTVVDVIKLPPPHAGGMVVLDLLRAAPLIGRSKALRVLRSARVASGVRLDELSAGQRDALVAVLGGRR